MNRLFEILLLLIEQKKMTAQQLADHFEVSKRTILRDIDKLMTAGVPVQSIQGYDGGITIDESYQFPFNHLNAEEKLFLLVGLTALHSVHKPQEAASLLTKLANFGTTRIPYIDIDLSSWYGSSVIPKIELIKQALAAKKQITFTYFKEHLASSKTVSPYQIVFRWSSWYVRAKSRQDDLVKLYKLNRMEDVQITNEPIEALEVMSAEKLTKDISYPQEKNYELTAIFAVKQKSRLIDEYGIHSFSEIEGSLHFTKWFANKEYLLTWLLSFGPDVTVLKPWEIKEELIQRIHFMQLLYEHDI